MASTDFVVRYRPTKGSEGTATPREAAHLSFESYAPWREPKQFKDQKNARAYCRFSKTREHVFCESRLEARKASRERANRLAIGRVIAT